MLELNLPSTKYFSNVDLAKLWNEREQREEVMPTVGPVHIKEIVPYL